MDSQAASSSQGDYSDGPRLVVWAPCMSPSMSLLPTLDPDSLYAATLLQARRGSSRYSLNAVSALLNANIPCLEDSTTGLTLADDLESIESYSRRQESARVLLEEDSKLPGASGEAAEEKIALRCLWAKRKAFEQYILTTLHPLIYQELFSQSLFQGHTAKMYQAGLPLLYKASLVNRLRKELRLDLAKRARFLQLGIDDGLGAILSDSNTMNDLQQEEERERQILANRGGINKDGKKSNISLAAFRGNGMLIEEKEKAARAFKEKRMKNYLSKVMDTIVEALGSNLYLYGSERPSILDIRLFSLLAPLLLPVDYYSTLSNSTIPILLRSHYTILVEYSDRIQRLIWPIEVQPILESNLSSQEDISRKQMCLTPGWPKIPGRCDSTNDKEVSMPMTIQLATSLGTFCGQVYRIASSVFASKPSRESIKGKEREDTFNANNNNNKKPAMTIAEKQDARRVSVGRFIWISTACIGIIATAFSTGLLAIEYVDAANDAIEEKQKATPTTSVGNVDHNEEDNDVTFDEVNGKTEIEEGEVAEGNVTEVDEDEEYEMVYLEDDAEERDDDDDLNPIHDTEVDDDQ